jgi:hypothetical protein
MLQCMTHHPKVMLMLAMQARPGPAAAGNNIAVRCNDD